ncbi:MULTISPECIES: hypothetical protein [Luteimonas]|uniref:hypothetical protein n=1 Tax=Luteimonas TaxID=83614 RepID=UPI000C7C52C0|nr:MULTISPECIES: hypothetical protein [Luteimonas]
MTGPDRRRHDAAADALMREALTPAQTREIDTLEHFGWELRFVRRPLFRDPVPVLFERAGTRWVVVEGDGTLNENPGFQIRD